MTRPFFVVGCPRSGTTLLRDLLRSHPHLTTPPESHFIPRFYRAFGDPSSDEEAWQLAQRILKNPRVSYWKIAAEEREFAGCRSFQEVTRRLFALWARGEGKPRWGDKTPHYVLEIPLLIRLFPEAQFIHIIRDGRDVALSWLRTRFEPRNLYMAARMWKGMVTQGRRDGAFLPAGAYLELRYETLLAAPEDTMRHVCEFLGEPYDAAVLSPHHIPREHSRRFAVLGERYQPSSGSILRNNAGKWRAGMSLGQRTLFESVAGDLLGELGYPLEGLAKPLGRGHKMLFEADHRLRFLAGTLRKLRRPYYRRAAVSFGWAILRRFLRRPAPARTGYEEAER